MDLDEPYEGSSAKKDKDHMQWKQPDLFLGVEGIRLPTIVFEVYISFLL